MQVVILLIIFIILKFFFLRGKSKNFGYMADILEHSKNSTTCDVILQYSKNQHLLPNTLIGIAKLNGLDVGTVLFLDWNNPKGLVIANNLEIRETHRGKGIASHLIHRCCRKIIENNGFGIFSSSHELDGIQRLHKLYWYKMKKDSSAIVADIHKININNIDFTNYPKHGWFDVPKEKRDLFLKHIVFSGLIILQDHKNIIGVTNIIDKEGHDVCYVKWFWGDISHLYQSIMKIMHVEYIAIPSIKVPKKIWDKSITYVYAKPKHINVPYFSNQDVYGWFLDR